MNPYELMDPTVCGRICATLAHSLWQIALLAIAARISDCVRHKPSAQSSYVLHVAAVLMGVTLIPSTFAVLGAVSDTAAISRSSRAKTIPAREATSASKAASSGTKAAFPVVLSPETAPAVSPRYDWRWVARGLLAFYLAGVALMLARLLAGLRHAHRLAAGAAPVAEGPLVAIVQAIARRWSMSAAPLLAETNRVATPRVVGLLRPTILLPASAISGLSWDELELVLAHELAHVRRHDMWVVVAQRLAEAVLFFNPALWYLSRRVSTLREYCCDDEVCHAQPQGALQIRYAAALLKLVDLAAPQCGREASLAMLAAGRSPSELRRRVARLLGEPLNEPLRLSRGSIWMLAAFALLLLVLPRTAPSQAPAAKADVAAKPTGDAALNNRFSFGSKVELLALGTHEQKEDRWWDARGKLLTPLPAPLIGCMVPQLDESGEPLASLPIAWKRADDHVSTLNVIWRRILFRIHNLPADGEVTWRVEEAHASAGGEVSVHGQRNPSGYFTRYFGIPADKKTVSLKVGVATGKWKTVAEAQPLGMTAIGNLNHGIVFSEVFDAPRGASIVISHNYFGQNFRVVAFDRQGKLHDTAGRGGMSAGNIYQTRATFPKLQRDDIDHFEFQTRDYEYVTLRGLPIEPPENR